SPLASRPFWSRPPFSGSRGPFPGTTRDGILGPPSKADLCRGGMLQLPGRYCRAYVKGGCSRGSQCPLLHGLHLTAPPAWDSSDDTSDKGSGSEHQTSSSSSRNWADMSDDLWTVQPALPTGQHAAEPPRARAGPAGDELPSFRERLPNFPEFLPREAGGALACRARDDAHGRDRQSRSAIRRRQRQLGEKWAAMRRLNDATSQPAWYALAGMPPCLPPPQHAPRTESSSPSRPPAPATSPRRARRKKCHDADDSDDGGSDPENTKVSV
ncbi:unnamed protein product, partial [Prorocentrum cordatum]